MLSATPLSALASLGLSDTSASAQLVAAAAVGPEITVLDGATVLASGQTTPIDIGSAFGGKTGPSKTFTIRNDGDQTLSMTKSFASTSHFTVSQPLKKSLLAGESTTFKVTLKTSAIWTGSEKISFVSNDALNEDGVENPFTFMVSGSVTPVPQEITVLLGRTKITNEQATPVDFGVGIVGLPGATKTFTIRNDGKLPLVLSAPVTGSTHFTVTQPSKTTLAPGKTVTFKVTLNTGEVFDGTEDILLASNDADNGDGVENPFVLKVSGRVSQLTVSIADSAPRNEGNKGTTKFPFVVTLSPPCPKTVTVKYSTSNDMAEAGNDFIGAQGTLTFRPRQTQKTINVLVTGDQLYEANNQTFKVNLFSPTLATIGDGTAVGTIVNDDTMPTITVSDCSAPETNTDSRGTGLVGYFFDIVLSKPSAVPVSCNTYTEDGTATVADGDYVQLAKSDSLDLTVFKPGQTRKTVTIVVRDDFKIEPNETFFFKICDVVGATVARDTGIGTIEDDDDAAYASAAPAAGSAVAQSDTPTTSAAATSVASAQDRAMQTLLTSLSAQQVKSRAAVGPTAPGVDETLRLLMLGALV